MPLTYKTAGVDIEAGNQFVKQIKPLAEKTHRPGVLSGLGGFGALFELPLERFQKPVLVSATDGVGTKLKLANVEPHFQSLGIDLVAMCVNDLITQGAEPLFFLDYYATGQLDLSQAKAVLSGIAQGCLQSNAALIGGETAEMPGVYKQGEFDLAGFCVGIVEKHKIIDGKRVQPGDHLIGLASSGLHSNGFSLVRKLIEEKAVDLHQLFEEKTLEETLLTPTRIYVEPLLELFQTIDVHALAHITGGGLIENLPRVLPPYTRAQLRLSNWNRPAIFDWLQTMGSLSETEMLSVFNCGIGMVVCVSEQAHSDALEKLRSLGETAFSIGRIETSHCSIPEVLF